ncbi:MAG: hypothetical protein HC773_18375 [Scytonema sp. CRU_2_7]|nr:hypothetical protein [Scytonema sp. CRU_2_7]
MQSAVNSHSAQPPFIHHIGASDGCFTWLLENEKIIVNVLATSCTPSSLDERLKQLVQEAQRYAPQSEERLLALTRLVDEILRYAFRRLCFARSHKIAHLPSTFSPKKVTSRIYPRVTDYADRSTLTAGHFFLRLPTRYQPLFDIDKDIYEQVRQKLLHDIDEKLDSYNPTLLPVKTWINDLRNRIYQKVLNDEQLKKLALKAQQHPPYSELRQYFLGELVEAIRLSGKLAHPHREKFSPQFYDLIYEEAVNKTLTYICRKINTYDPNRGNRKFMNWVNFRLDRSILESYHEFRDPKLSELPSLSDLEMIVQQEEPSSLFEMVREKIEEDSENLFKQAHIKNRPDANFQAIALARLSGKIWDEISAEFQISISTLSVFYQRCCHKFRSQFREECN